MKPKTPTREACEALEGAMRQLGRVGEYRALNRHDLRWALSRFGFVVSDREFRLRVTAAPAYGLPICSGQSGYFVAQTAEEVEHCIADLESRRIQLEQRASALRDVQRNFQASGLLF